MKYINISAHDFISTAGVLSYLKLLCCGQTFPVIEIKGLVFQVIIEIHQTCNSQSWKKKSLLKVHIYDI